ncbi:URC4/urg3 family protein [Ramlibacter sp. AW1]|uniref:URC4/urg3 family protein n=1 Tax=Ramlibacter aurantiacus TaxID=2801330 RepID=A0A936ZMJ8_9BURK|nr:URC4/urg3 family protein [Ramlibacter aurantiacus]MBL0418931.1 URC4/urg3 family protein [Ramlibacter aurantiacus]
MSEVFVHARANGESAAAELRTTHAVRQRCGQLLARARAGQGWFEVNDGALDDAAGLVVDTTRRRFSNLHIPLHSRWRHFEAGGVDRKLQLDRLLRHMQPPERAHSMIDLVTVSVLLDAGAGPDWKYVEPATGQTYTRSEGLAVASFHAFTAGLFSSDPRHPYQADARGLRALLTDHLAQAFQVGPSNPLVGLENRAILLRRLGEILSEQPEVFGESGRPGSMFDMIISPLGPDLPHTADVDAHDILSQLLLSLSGIWPADNQIGGVPLGDCWRHPAVHAEGLSDGWVPFHKLTQWLTYSMLEPFAWNGVQVRGVNGLTALPEYRNGGLLLDSGVLRLRDPQAAQNVWQPGDEIIVEWRALTVSLLDELAERVRHLLRTDADHLPLGKVLEGGTWQAGRELAQRLRGGLPPLRVASDGTVF